jgi:helicase
MKIVDLPIAESAIDFLKSEGYSELYPPQGDSIDAGILDGNSVLVSTPTASGKTLIATIAMMHYLSKNSGKVIYLSPLRALATEKFNDFKKITHVDLGKQANIQISTGDFDSQDLHLAKGDVLILTNEKMDAIMRRNSKWIDEIGLVIADEIHLIGDPDRGPTLEMILSKFRLSHNRPQIIGLSATLANSDEIAKWLDATLVENEWRPIPLSEGVYDSGRVVVPDGDDFHIKPTSHGSSIDLAMGSIKDGDQSLVFADTRRSALSLAKKASFAVPKLLKKSDVADLDKISKNILRSSEPTQLIKDLAELVRHGVAFHHAGLNQNCRTIIENEFRNKKIKFLSSTPTLAAGVNLPARRVVISSMTRYNAKVGYNLPISVMEYKQLCGRAGRPQYDKYGEAIIVGKGNPVELIDHYIYGDVEPIESKITDERALRIHVLSLVVTKPNITKNEIFNFFMHTFGGQQSTDSTVKFGIRIALRFLEDQDFITQKNNKYRATDFGKKVSILYIDPMTAKYFRDAVEDISGGRKHTFGLLYLLSTCNEFFPQLSMRNKDYDDAVILIDNYASELLEPISEYDCNRSLLALHYWITESSELSLSDRLGVESGDMHRIAETAEWLAYCLREVLKYTKHQSNTHILHELNVLRRRIIYGVQEELVGLVRIRGIGRIRARNLFKRGIKNLNDLRDIPIDKLAKVDKIGAKVAKNIKIQLDQA